MSKKIIEDIVGMLQEGQIDMEDLKKIKKGNEIMRDVILVFDDIAQGKDLKSFFAKNETEKLCHIILKMFNDKKLNKDVIMTILLLNDIADTTDKIIKDLALGLETKDSLLKNVNDIVDVTDEISSKRMMPQGMYQ